MKCRQQVLFRKSYIPLNCINVMCNLSVNQFTVDEIELVLKIIKPKFTMGPAFLLRPLHLLQHFFTISLQITVLFPLFSIHLISFHSIKKIQMLLRFRLMNLLRQILIHNFFVPLFSILVMINSWQFQNTESSTFTAIFGN